MIFLSEIIFLCFFVFLYVAFSFAHDDFMLLRKNVSMEHLFNTSFVGFFLGLLCARIIFVLEHFSPAYFHPLVFFLFPYFPGLSFIGGIIGGLGYIGYSTHKKKIPFSRITDIFAVAFFVSVTVGKGLVELITIIASHKLAWIGVGEFGAFVLCSVLLCLLLAKSKVKDGESALISGILFSVLLLATRVLTAWKKFSFGGEDILLLVFFFMVLILFIQQQFFPSKLYKK